MDSEADLILRLSDYFSIDERRISSVPETYTSAHRANLSRDMRWYRSYLGMADT
jgi:hypothetical protein